MLQIPINIIYIHTYVCTSVCVWLYICFHIKIKKSCLLPLWVCKKHYLLLLNFVYVLNCMPFHIVHTYGWGTAFMGSKKIVCWNHTQKNRKLWKTSNRLQGNVYLQRLQRVYIYTAKTVLIEVLDARSLWGHL